LARTEETKPNTTKANIHPEHKNCTAQNKHKKTKAMFGGLIPSPAQKQSRLYSTVPGAHMGLRYMQ